MDNTQDELLFAKLNLETARIPWRELQRFFAQGKVLMVSEEMDLVTIAQTIASDHIEQVERMVRQTKLKPVNDLKAKQWVDEDTEVWAVVVAPWVLVQEDSSQLTDD